MTLKPKFAAMIALLLAGCANHDVSPTPARADKYAPQQISFSGEDDLNDHVAFSPIERSFDTAGLMHIIVPIRNTVDMDSTVDYRFTWLDDNKTPIDSPTGWQTMTLHSNLVENIMGNSSSPRAKDFRMDLRYAK